MPNPSPLLMIPGPIEISPAVRDSFGGPPPGHLAPRLIEAFGSALENMRRVWLAGPTAQPLVVAGGGTIAMDMAAVNLVEAGESVIVLHTGYFSDRMAEMLRRRGAEVRVLPAAPGDVPSVDRIRDEVRAATRAGPVKAIFATHVDTSTGVLLDPAPIAAMAREHGILSVFDGVCATAAERFEMAAWGADVYLTASQKAIGLPPGLALSVVGERALRARRELKHGPPPHYLDWLEWQPVMQAYEQRRPAYFSTPATNLVLALDVGLREILEHGMERRFSLHVRAAGALDAAWRTLGLSSVPLRPEITAHTLSALYYPTGIDGSLLARIAERGVVVAGGLLPAIKDRYFRIGHMGFATVRTELLERTVSAVAEALRDSGHPADPEAAAAALSDALQP